MVEMSRPIRLVPDQKSSGSASFMSAKTAHQIDAEAADWAGGVDRGPLTAGQEQAFQAWLSEDVRCMGAFGRMRALALSTERAKALGPGFDPGDFAPILSYGHSRRVLLRAGGATAATALVGTIAAWKLLRPGSRFRTGKGEMKVVALKDGSVVTLNTASEIVVNYSEGLRSVELVRGEALFDVAKNKARRSEERRGGNE